VHEPPDRGILCPGFDDSLGEDSGPGPDPPNGGPRIPPDPADLAWVRRFRKQVAAHIAELAAVVRAEIGKPEFETLTSEIAPLLAACRWLERRAARVLKTRAVAGGGVWQLGQRHAISRVPLGRVAIIATWNYPLQLLGVQLAQALVAGNQVTVKPSERTPRSQGLLLDLALAAGLDPSRLVRTEPDRDAGARLLESGRFDHVIFTGSTEVGLEVAGTLARSLTPSTLELSGCDSAIVLADADPALAARSVHFALRLNAGQTCMAPRRALVERPVYSAFLDAIEGAAARSPLASDPLAPEGACSRRVAQAAVDAGGRWIGASAERPPHLVADCPVETDLFRGGHFGPALAIVPVETADDALELHRAVPRKLATSVFTRDAAAARRLAPRLGSVVVTVNDCVIPTGHPGLSIGGLGPSGWGLSRGAEGLLAMTRPLFFSTTHPRVRTPTDPPSAAVTRTMTRVIRRLYG
jgi:aldehyde dehydrogenase (NAD+)